MPIGKGSTLDLSASQSDGYRAEIDGLRAVSILSVVLYHAGVPGFQAGYLGVDVFFVISGFLITGQLLREGEATGVVWMSMFYARRIRRLAPAFVAMAAGSAVLALTCLPPIVDQRLFGNALTRAALFYYNIALWRGGYAYGGEPADQQVLMHTWSLAVEEQFYLVWPMVCLIALRVGRPVTVFSATLVPSLIGAWWFSPHEPDAVFFLLPFRAWELGLGACVAASPRWSSWRYRGGAALLGAGLVAGVLLWGKAPGDPLRSRLMVTLGAALVAAFGEGANLASSLLRTRPMVFLGRISYAWYLWHWPLLAVDRLTTFQEESAIPFRALVAGLALGVLTHLGIEAPAMRVRITSPRRALAWGAAATALIALAGVWIELRSSRLERLPRNAASLARLARAPVRPCETDTALLGCNLSVGSTDAGPFLLLWGDSFAQALSPAFPSYSRDTGSSVRLLAHYSCPPLLGATPASDKEPSKPNESCRDALQSVETALHRERARIQGVIIAGSWLGHVPGDSPDRSHSMFDRSGRTLEGSYEPLSRGLDGTLDFLRSIGVRSLVVGAPPEFPFNVPRCLLWISTECFVDRSWKEAARAQVLTGIRHAIGDRDDVRYVDLFERLCPLSRCSGGTLDQPLLADRTHLTAVAARELVLPILRNELEWLRGAPMGSDGLQSPPILKRESAASPTGRQELGVPAR